MNTRKRLLKYRFDGNPEQQDDAMPASPTLVRDTICSVASLGMNGILGAAAILGGLRQDEQPYNADSGNTCIVMILTTMGVFMIEPDFIPAANWKTYSVFTTLIMVVLCGMFLRLQTTRYSYFYSYCYGEQVVRKAVTRVA